MPPQTTKCHQDFFFFPATQISTSTFYATQTDKNVNLPKLASLLSITECIKVLGYRGNGKTAFIFVLTGSKSTSKFSYSTLLLSLQAIKYSTHPLQ